LLLYCGLVARLAALPSVAAGLWIGFKAGSTAFRSCCTVDRLHGSQHPSVAVVLWVGCKAGSTAFRS